MNNQEFIAKFQAEYNKTVIWGKFAHDEMIPFEFNTSQYIEANSFEMFTNLVDDEEFILFAFDKDGETKVQFQFESNEMDVELLVKMVKSLNGH